MTFPLALRGVDPRMAQFAQFAEDPAAAVVASGGGNSILFPRQPSAGILTPEDQAMVRRNILLHLAAGLLQSGGRSPNQQGTLANIGSALAGIDLPGAQMSALRMRAITDEMNRERQSRQDITSITSQSGGEGQSAYEQLSAVIPRLVSLGPDGIKAAAQLAQVADALKPSATQPRNAQEISGVVDNRMGSPTFGQAGTFLIPYPGAPRDQWTFVKGKPERVPGQELTATQRTRYGEQAEFGSAALAAWKPLEQIRNDNPGVEAEVGKVVTAPSFARAIPGFRSADEAVAALKRAGASQAAQAYLRAKISWLAQIERTRYTGARGITGVLLKQFFQEFMPGLDELGNAQMRQNEIQAMLSAQGNSGFDEHPDIWQRAAKRHGVSNVDLNNILSGGSLDPRLDSIHARYPAIR